MGYQIVKSRKSWSLCLVKDRGNGKREKLTFPKGSEAYVRFGLNESMTIERAREQLKARVTDDPHELYVLEKKAKATARIARERRAESEWLPDKIVVKFERTVIPPYRIRDPHWRKAIKAIVAVNLHPAKWRRNAMRFYEWFFLGKVSPDYVGRLIRVLNIYGEFYCDELDITFGPIPLPTGPDRKRINKAYILGNGGRTKSSDRLPPEVLEEAKGSLTTGNYQWLFIAVWLGLRPHEIEQRSTHPEFFEERTNFQFKFQELHVFQDKLVASVEPGREWKIIPLVEPQMKTALVYLHDPSTKRPLHKTMRRVFGDRIYLYGGRKGFARLMVEKGYYYEDVKAWLGHRKGTTDRVYADPRQVRFSGKVKKPRLPKN